MQRSSNNLVQKVLCVPFAIVLFAASLLMSKTAWASSQSGIQKIENVRDTIVMYMDSATRDGMAESSYTYEKGMLKNLKSSNTKIVRAFDYGDMFPEDYATKRRAEVNFVGLKPGTAQVTFTYKGEAHTVKVVVKKYTRPVKTLKVGSTNYARKLKKRPYTVAKYGSLSGKKLTVKAAKGWKITGKIEYAIVKNNRYRYKKIRNGGILPKGDVRGVWINLKNVKTGHIVTAYVYVNVGLPIHEPGID